MTDTSRIANALNIKITESAEMKQKMLGWHNMYFNKSAWLKKRVESLELPSAIASEFSRLTLTEFSANLNNEVIDRQFKKLLTNSIFCDKISKR